MRFEFATATRILFGAGALSDIAGPLKELGRRALLITGADSTRAQPLLEVLRVAGIESITVTQAGEPSVRSAADGAARARAERVDIVIGFGGGSAIDAAKAMAALATNEGDPLDYLEVIGRGRALTQDPLPFVAIPTTAGTGAEVTRNAVLAAPEHRVKVSLRSPRMLARLAVVDPKLTLNLPLSVTATTGLDALTQLIEAFVSCRANPMTDGFCREGIGRAARALRRVCQEPADLSARTDMALASMLSGLALANAGLGAVHGFAGPIGGMFPAPHGAVCAALLPHVMTENLRVLRARASGAEALDRFTEIARRLTGRDDASADDGAAWVAELTHELSIESLRNFGVTPGDVPKLCAMAAQSSSMKGNPLPWQADEFEAVLRAAL